MTTNLVAVAIERLSKSYGTTPALQNLQMEVRRGEIVALVGPNGAGKTTALKLMAGLLAPTSGSVRLAGYDVHQQPLEAKRYLSFVPDQPFLYEQLTIAELLAFMGGVYRLDPALVVSRANALLALFDVAPLASHRIGALSYGMKSRVALIISLLHEPQVLLMDEPFFGLDPQTLRLIKRLLRDRAQEGMAIILSTHQLPIVEDIADRIAIMNHGRVVAMGTLSELRTQHGGYTLEELFFDLTGDSRV